MENYYDYDLREVPAEDSYLRKLLDYQYTPEFEAYCEDCKFRAHGSARPTANCWPSIREKMHCFQAYVQGRANVPTQHDYSGQLSTACSTLCDIKGLMETHETPDYSEQIAAICNLLSSIDSKTDDQEIDFDESMLSSETFKKIDKLGKLVSPGFNTGNMTASEWLTVMLIAKKLRLQV